MFSVPPADNQPSYSLDDLLVALDTFLKDSNLVLESMESENVAWHSIQRQANILEQQLAQWQDIRAPEYKSTSIGQIDQDTIDPRPGYWPGSIDFYCDHYTANVWNTCRAARLLLLDFVTRLTSTAKGTGDPTCEHKIRILLSEVLASIPYHLVENLHLFVQEAAQGATEISAPGKVAGGLLLMKVLHNTSQLGFVEPQMRSYLRECLGWIGENMGIGQASVLSRARNGPSSLFESDKMVLWTGFLI